MTISEKQLLANRINALKGGVKTKEGKETVKYNALKHGLLAKEAVIPVGEDAETPEEYKAFLLDLLAEFKPEGHMELVLTKKIAGCCWILRRAYRYGVRLIGKALDNQIEDFSNKRGPGQVNEGIDDKTAQMEDEIENLQKGKADFLQLCKEDIHELIEEIRQHFMEIEEEILDFIGYWDGDETNLEEKVAALQRQTRRGSRYKRKMEIIKRLSDFPSKEEVWLLLRYEGGIEKQLYNAMSELERLQKMRSWGDIPVPSENTGVDEDTNEQDGFDSQDILEFIKDFVKKERGENGNG